MTPERLAQLLAAELARTWPSLAGAVTFLPDVLAIARRLVEALAPEPPVRVVADEVTVVDRRPPTV